MKTKDYSDLIEYNTISHSPNVAAMDLGTNSCRLLISSVDITSLHRNFFKGKQEPRQLRVIDSFAKIVGLGEGIKQTGLLSLEAIERTIDALYACKKKIDHYHISEFRAVATEACRQAKNSKILIDAARNDVGIELEVISPREEARLVLKGCSGVISEKKEYGILLDIGGGSTEVVWLKRDKNSTSKAISVIDSVSLPYGIVTLSDTYTHNGADPSVFSRAQQNISQTVQFFMVKNRIKDLLQKNMVQVVTSSGTVTTIGSLALGLKSYHRNSVDGKDFHSDKISYIGRGILSRYLRSSLTNILSGCEKGFISKKIDHPYAREGNQLLYYRMGLLSSGIVIINSVLETIGDCTIRIADRGVREGVLFDLIERIRNHQSVSWNMRNTATKSL
ncbi:MAG: hypothetical protein LBF72_02605 [Holosporales bacterium]|jgi:exopolyphosphatase/guanosine-5'-triphosphate,3'-diphosphate pyrophosphatase|nr:hypothetical protein [Holosporales bacterium]